MWQAAKADNLWLMQLMSNWYFGGKNSPWNICVQSIEYIFILLSFKALRNGSEWHQYADPCSICFHIHLGSLGPSSGWHGSIVLCCKDELASFYKPSAATSAGGRTFSQSVPTGSNKEEFCEPHCQCWWSAPPSRKRRTFLTNGRNA